MTELWYHLYSVHTNDWHLRWIKLVYQEVEAFCGLKVSFHCRRFYSGKISPLLRVMVKWIVKKIVENNRCVAR
jgi:hypothetical protein